MLKIGDTYKQINPIEQYGFNYVGRTFKIKEIQPQGVIMVCDDIGLCCGIEAEQLPNYFKRYEDIVIVAKKYDSQYEKVIRNGNVTIVILKDGSKGVSKCMPDDKYDAEKGLEIATLKAQIKSLGKKLKGLTK